MKYLSLFRRFLEQAQTACPVHAAARRRPRPPAGPFVLAHMRPGERYREAAQDAGGPALFLTPRAFFRRFPDFF